MSFPGMGIEWSQEDLVLLESFWYTPHPIRVWADKFPDRTEPAIWSKGFKKFGPRPQVFLEDRSWVWRIVAKILQDGNARTSRQLAKMTGLNHENIHRQMKVHHGKEVRIGDWYKKPPRPQAHWEPMWEWVEEGEDPTKDARKPRPMTDVEISRKQRKRKKMIKENAIRI